MAKSYYGYVKRDVENQVDWASITKEMVTTLEEEQTRREKKKADIDKASREFGKVLTDAEGSSHKALNEFWLDSSSSIQELRRMQDDLLKRGLLDYKSYVSQRQNLTDGSGELINLVKGFDSKWTAVKDDPNASAFDYWNIGNIQGFGNFSDYKTWANPTDGKLSLGKMVLNPKTGQTELSNNPTEYQQISFLKNRMNQRAPKYDYEAAIKKVTGNVGRYVKAKRSGAAKTIEDVTKSDAYQKQINTWIDAMIENPFNAGSMLTDWLGYSENYTDDEKQSNEFDLVDTGKVDDNDNPIMMKSYKYVETEVDPVQKGSGLRRPKLKEEQKTQLREAIRNEIESRLDYIETAAPRSESDKSRDITAKTEQDTVTLLAQLQSGQKEEDRKIAATNLAGLEKNSNIVKIAEYTDKLIVTRQNTKGETFTEDIIKPSSTRDFVKGASTMFTDIKDLNKALGQSGITIDSIGATGIEDGTVLFERKSPPKKKGGLTKFNEQIDSDFSNIEIEGEQLITDDDFEDDAIVIGKLTPLATKYGIRLVNPTNYSGSQSIQFLVGSGTNMIDQVIEFNDTDPDGLLESLKGFIKSSKDAEARYLALDTEKKGIDYSNK
jgi:hypothetical protein